MKIQKIHIDKFRGFNNVEFNLWTNITVITWQNGTQKTTLLWLLSQPFSISDMKNPMHWEKPLSGESFKSDFSEKFKFSKKFDKIWDHKWTLYFDDNTKFPVGSIDRWWTKKWEIRIRKVNEETWGKDASKWSWYIQLPVIYLSLKRLLPIGEDSKLQENKKIILDDDEKNFYKKWHNKILLLTREEEALTEAIPLWSSDKQTLGANTNYYNWETNSAGQDNIWKILLSILSFRRLQKKFPWDYKWWILTIDEIDTTFYPGSQIKLLSALSKFSSKFHIQIIFTTHSLSLIKEISKFREQPHGTKKFKLVFLRKQGSNIVIDNNIDFNYIKNHLKLSLSWVSTNYEKINVFTEDKEWAIFAKFLLWNSRTKYLNFHTEITLGSWNLIEMSKKIPYFQFPKSIIILDWDIKTTERNQIQRMKKKNIILLPWWKSPEQLISEFLYNKEDTDKIWLTIDDSFSHQYCFQEYSNNEIQNDREKAKKWFNSHIKIWWRNANKILNPWKKENQREVDEFLEKFNTLFSKY